MITGFAEYMDIEIKMKVNTWNQDFLPFGMVLYTASLYLYTIGSGWESGSPIEICMIISDFD
jgi:hypothetical protein